MQNTYNSDASRLEHLKTFVQEFRETSKLVTVGSFIVLPDKYILERLAVMRVEEPLELTYSGWLTSTLNEKRFNHDYQIIHIVAELTAFWIDGGTRRFSKYMIWNCCDITPAHPFYSAEDVAMLQLARLGESPLTHAEFINIVKK